MNPILGVSLAVLLLTFRIPLTTFEHVKSLFQHKDKRTLPTLSNRILCVTVKTIMQCIPLSMLWKMTRMEVSGKKSQRAKKLDANNEDDGWEGYLISESAEQSEIEKNSDMIILYAHGGAFMGGHPLAMLDMFIDWIKTWKLNYGVNVQILSLNYRLAPEYPFPAARDNMLECYNWLVTKKKISPSKIVLAGDSSGGNLAAISALYLINNPRKYSIDPPAALLLISPFLSLLTTAKSYTYNQSYDYISPFWLDQCVNAYLGDTNLQPSDPLVSPLFEDKLSGLPKVWACIGSIEVLLDDTKEFIDKLIKSNVDAELVIEDGNIHGYSLYKQVSRDGSYEKSIKQIGNFLFGKRE